MSLFMYIWANPLMWSSVMVELTLYIWVRWAWKCVHLRLWRPEGSNNAQQNDDAWECSCDTLDLSEGQATETRVTVAYLRWYSTTLNTPLFSYCRCHIGFAVSFLTALTIVAKNVSLGIPVTLPNVYRLSHISPCCHEQISNSAVEILYKTCEIRQ